jgi:hypothetical protein
MSHFLKIAKKTSLHVVATLVISLIYIPISNADDPAITPPPATPAPAPAAGGGSSITALLAQIAAYTNGTLTALTSISNPVVVSIVGALTNLTSPDNATNPASPTPALQSSFTTYVAQSAASTAAQATLQQTLLAPLIGNLPVAKVPFANDLAFTSLLGAPTPIFNPDPRPNAKSIDSGLNYIQFASGLLIQHAVPDPTWKGSAGDQIRYGNYFSAMSAAQTFNAYILSQLYEDTKNTVPAAQTALINQASDPANWFAIITNESIGAVLRQMLMYQSQSYIVQTQILQNQKMQLAAAAINNTLLMLSSQASEGLLVRKAVAPLPGGF